MTSLTLNATDEQIRAFNWRLGNYNNGSGEEPVTLEQFLQIMFNEKAVHHESGRVAEQRAGLDTDYRMIEIYSHLMSQEVPEDKELAIAAMYTALNLG